MATGLRFSLCLVLALGGPLGGCLGQTHTPLTSSGGNTKTAVREVLRSTVTSESALIETTHGLLRVTAWPGDTFRLQLARDASVRALGSFAVDNQSTAPVQMKVDQSDTLILLRTEQAMLRIDKTPLRVRLLDASGEVIVDDVARASFGQAELGLEFSLSEGEHIYGLGDKLLGFDRRGSKFELWNTDAFGFKQDTDPLYKSIPFLLFLRQGRAHGLFIDHPGRASLDAGKARPDVLSFTAPAADSLDVYLFAGRDPKRVLEAYTALTGRTPLPPRWALGHHHSRYGFSSEQEVRGVVSRMQASKIPLDAIWLDIDYQDGNAPFTVNRKTFPGFAKMIADFQAAGVQTIAITDLHIKSYQRQPSPGYAPYDSGAAGDHFIRDQKGFFEGPVWPGASVFPEFTRESTRTWWGELYREFVEQGVAGFWNDMNEPAVFVPSKTFPETLEHRLDDGTTRSHALLHNAYGMLNARATYEGVKRLRPALRPFILTRAAYAGAQKYAASWTGDNTADRAHLALTIPQLLNLGVSGYPFNGADVGGFIGCPSPALFAEWMELGALQPFFRNHSKQDACRREPWVFGTAIEARARRAVERRYRLLPYLYTLFEEASRSGLPVMRPVWLEYPRDSSGYGSDTVYLLGRDLLVAPQLQEGVSTYRVTLPDDAWYDRQTLASVKGGPLALPVSADESVRLFVRAGAILPEAAVTQNLKRPPTSALSLEVWPGEDCRGSLYHDDGESFAYQQGAFRRVSYECERTDAALVVSARSTGAHPVWWNETRLVVRDVPRAPVKVQDGSGAALAHAFDGGKKTLNVTLPGAAADFEIRASW
jgi:alpha-glucosidase